MKNFFSLFDYCSKTHGNKFLRSVRILNSSEFEDIFSNFYCFHTRNFTFYCKFSGKRARIGLVVGKKYARRAVTRNTLKRLIRESFRSQQERLFGYDIVIRLRSKVSNFQFSSATSSQLKIVYGHEISELFDRFLNERNEKEVNSKHELCLMC